MCRRSQPTGLAVGEPLPHTHTHAHTTATLLLLRLLLLQYARTYHYYYYYYYSARNTFIYREASGVVSFIADTHTHTHIHTHTDLLQIQWRYLLNQVFFFPKVHIRDSGSVTCVVFDTDTRWHTGGFYDNSCRKGHSSLNPSLQYFLTNWECKLDR